jgi:transcriptional accessory protein Tex/SPT6
VGQRVTVTVLDVDLARNRIALSMRSASNEQKQSGFSGNAAVAGKQKPRRKQSTEKPEIGKNRRKRNEPFNNPFAELMKKRS